MTYIIRPLTQNDNLSEVSNIYEQSWIYAYHGLIPQDYLDNIPHGGWVNNLQKPDMHSLVILEDNRYVGTAGFCKSRFPEFEGYGEIVSIYLLPECIGKGFGKALISAVIAELRKMGYQKIFLWVLEGNKNARTFYEKNSFTCSNVFRDDIIGGREIREVNISVPMSNITACIQQNTNQKERTCCR